MPGIRFDGLATGLQTSALIDALINFERRPLTLIQSRQDELGARRELFRTFNTNLVALSNAAKAIDNQSSILSGPTLDEELLAYTTASSNEGVVTATATGNASPGSIDVEVLAIAQVGRQISFGFATDTEIVAQAGETLSIDFGGAAPIDITVGAAGATLNDLRNLVNSDPNNGGSVRADVLFDGTSHRLVIAGTETGAANDLVITTNVTGPGGTGPLFDATLAQTASDAQIDVLGLPVTRPGNVIDDLFGGITLELHALSTPGETTTIEIARDNTAIEEKLQALVDAYNPLRQFASDQSNFNEANETAGLLSGDSTLRGIDRKLQGVLAGQYTFAGNPFSSLSQIGLRFEEGGTLSLDSDALSAALDQDASSVRQLLSGDGTSTGDGAATALAKAVEEMTRSETGTLAVRDDAFDRQIRALDQSIERFESRLAQREERLIERFSRLESLISGLQAQGGFIGSAFNNLNNLNNNSRN